MMRGNKGIQICHGPIARIPKEVVFEILVRISSVKTIALCKSVCKDWRGLISDPRFAELHLARSKICLLVRNRVKDRTWRTVWLLDDEDGIRGFHSGHCCCRPGTETESCEICLSAATTAITKLKIPAEQKWITCNGLLCLYSSNAEYTKDSPIVVCNPITGEFVTLPNRDHDVEAGVVFCGLGLDPKTGRYKVVMLYFLPIPNSKSLDVLKATVHVLGTDSWRELDTPDVSLEVTCLSGPALLGGALYWVYREGSSDTNGIVSFDFESERLCYRSLPSLPLRYRGDLSNLAVAVLGGRLCVYPSYAYGKLYMCVVDEHSVSDSSPEWISHDLSEVRASLKLICSLDDGALLMYCGYIGNELVYYDPPRGSLRFKRLKIDNYYKSRGIAYTPSFLSLKDIVRPGSVEVLNVYSRSDIPVVAVD